MIKLNTFYEKLESQNAKRHNIYKKLVRMAEKKFPALQESVGTAYVEDNKTTLHNLNVLKNHIEMGGGDSSTNDNLLMSSQTHVNTYQENYNTLVGGVFAKFKDSGFLSKSLSKNIDINGGEGDEKSFFDFLNSDTYKIDTIINDLNANESLKTYDDIIKFYGKKTPINLDIINYIKICYSIYVSEKVNNLKSIIGTDNSDNIQKNCYAKSAAASYVSIELLNAYISSKNPKLLEKVSNQIRNNQKTASNAKNVEEAKKAASNSTFILDDALQKVLKEDITPDARNNIQKFFQRLGNNISLNNYHYNRLNPTTKSGGGDFAMNAGKLITLLNPVEKIKLPKLPLPPTLLSGVKTQKNLIDTQKEIEKKIINEDLENLIEDAKNKETEDKKYKEEALGFIPQISRNALQLANASDNSLIEFKNYYIEKNKELFKIIKGKELYTNILFEDLVNILEPSKNSIYDAIKSLIESEKKLKDVLDNNKDLFESEKLAKDLIRDIIKSLAPSDPLDPGVFIDLPELPKKFTGGAAGDPLDPSSSIIFPPLCPPPLPEAPPAAAAAPPAAAAAAAPAAAVLILDPSSSIIFPPLCPPPLPEAPKFDVSAIIKSFKSKDWSGIITNLKIIFERQKNILLKDKPKSKTSIVDSTSASSSKNTASEQIKLLIETLKNKTDLDPETTENLKTLLTELQNLGDVSGLKAEDIQKVLGVYGNTLDSKLAENRNAMNKVIAGFFEQFAENMPKWLLVQEYSKKFEDYEKLNKILKGERILMEADERAQLRVAIAMAKLGALFSPAPISPVMAASPFNPRLREEKLAAIGTESSGLTEHYYEPVQNPTAKGGADSAPTPAPSATPAKPGEDPAKEAEKKAKEETETINNAKKDANELSQIISQIQSEYKKSYAFEANKSNDPKFDDKAFNDEIEGNLKKIITNGPITSDERNVVAKWASIKEEQKWVDGLKAKIDKARELYDKVQKAITKLANVPNDPELTEMIRTLGLFNDGNMDIKDVTDDKINYKKFSIPNNLSNILTEITSAYRLVFKAYSNAGESLTKKQNQPPTSSSSGNDSARRLTAKLDKIKLKLAQYNNIVDGYDQIINASKDKTNYTDVENYNVYKLWIEKKTHKEFTFGKSTKINKDSLTQKELLSQVTSFTGTINIPPDSRESSVYTELENNIDTIQSVLNEVEQPPEISLKEDKGTSGTSKNDTLPNNILSHISDVNDIITTDIISKMIRPLEMRTKTRMSPEYGVLNENPTLLDDIYTRYQKSKAADGSLLSAINLENMLNANNLIPSEVLKISTVDKMIFAFIIIVFRLIAVTLTEYIISKGWISSFANGIIAIGVIYTIIFIAFVMIVNFDLWRLRILFNYVNLHVNSMIIISHLAMVWGLFAVVLLLAYNIDFGISGIRTSITTEEDQAKLSYRLEMVTALLWVIILMLVAIF